ncbi:FAD-dependent oxidoreductase [Roseibium album]|uniref:Putative FAD-binding dehydrogenase n=1 Tax=Roseibium album TaxID=311410 RepID=A0A0M6Z6U8_9HYPH|nr:FAD-dependent oxidoreductase [Roseibium album]CTQ57946.1 putative FAD-binding dehydrogenase [Roseibium album]CTQ67772.1 putative FAD-binding dehydrogenase [Roseibium album]CTQ70242.1 putative FAD-binding dehydrogenase [Roseibium album]
MAERHTTTVQVEGAQVPVVADCDVVVVGAGPAGHAASVSAARNGASVTLLERYHHLGGMASGGMVLVLDDMVNEGNEIVTTGVVSEFVERMERQDAAVYPPPAECQTNWDMWQKWSRWGCIDFHKAMMPQPIIHAVAFDPDAWKRVSLDMVVEAKVNLRTHSWFSDVLMENGRITGVIAQTKLGRQAIRAKYVVDATGDLDVGVAAGAKYIDGQYIVTTVFRLSNVDTDKAVAFEFSDPETYKKLDREARRRIGGAWGMWWLKTPIPGVVWCNCPHMPGYDGLSVEDMVASEIEGRERMMKLHKFAKENIPGFENATMLGAAEQMGVRQTRMLQGEYVVNKDDVKSRRYFTDTVCRGRDYYTPYRALLPKGIDNLIVAGRHYSVESDAQKLSREIPPCMAQGEAAGVATALALNGDVPLRMVDHTAIQKQMRAQGADPGDRPSPNALIEDNVAAE